MGGVEVDADTQATRVPGLYAAGEVSGGMHGSNRLGGNSLSDLLVFGKRAGTAAAEYVAGLGEQRPAIDDKEIEVAAATAVQPFGTGEQPETGQAENPYTLHQELQQSMNDLVGIIRREGEVREALERLQGFKARAQRVQVEGHRQFNPGWHLALDLRNMLLISECVAMAALERTESRGGHTREDHPAMDPEWRQENLVLETTDGSATPTIALHHQPVPEIRLDLFQLFDPKELAKYFTPAEMQRLDAGSTGGEAK
jgi:succinate dehydrogenase / fumarate reductase flavoprotein subunit